MTSQWVADADQPPPGGTCDDCGHFALRHNENGCDFPRKEKPPCQCEGFLWNGNRWPRPWRAANAGGMSLPPQHGYIILQLVEIEDGSVFAEVSSELRRRIEDGPIQYVQGVYLAEGDRGLTEVYGQLMDHRHG